MTNKDRYLICLDLDGTLLTTKKTILFKTKRYIKKLIKQGHIVTFSSGRPFRSLEKYYKELDLKFPIVCYNGAHILNPTDKTFKEETFKLNKDEVNNIYSTFINKYIESVYAEGDNSIYIDKKDAFLFTFYDATHKEIHVGKIDEILKEDTFTMVIHLFKHTDDIKSEMTKYCKEHFKNLSLRFWFHEEYCEAHRNDVSKAIGIKHLASYYNIPLDKVIVFGDADNDYEMLHEFKNSFLMKNGNDNLRTVAKFVTKKDNDHNGIVYALKDFFKNN